MLAIHEELLLEGRDLVGVLLAVSTSLGHHYDPLGFFLHSPLKFAGVSCCKHFDVARRLVRVLLRHVATELLVHWERSLAVFALEGVVGFELGFYDQIVSVHFLVSFIFSFIKIGYG